MIKICLLPLFLLYIFIIYIYYILSFNFKSSMHATQVLMFCLSPYFLHGRTIFNIVISCHCLTLHNDHMGYNHFGCFVIVHGNIFGLGTLYVEPTMLVYSIRYITKKLTFSHFFSECAIVF